MTIAKRAGLRRLLVAGGIVTLSLSAGAIFACGSSSSPLGAEDASGIPVTENDAGVDASFSIGPEDGSTTIFTAPDGATMIAVGDSGLCTLGSAASLATTQDLNIFGNIVYYYDGGALPAGPYQAKYLDGCMRYSYAYLGFNWTIQSGQPGMYGWFFVGASSDDLIAQPPGTGFQGTDAADGFTDFDACVAANLALPPVDFYFDGGPLGVWLNDSIYVDNTVGVDGRNPKWSLTYLEKCPPGITAIPPK